jgi:hypothetical protein
LAIDNAAGVERVGLRTQGGPQEKIPEEAGWGRKYVPSLDTADINVPTTGEKFLMEERN